MLPDGNVIDEHATTWYRPDWDGEGKGAVAGDQAMALSRVAKALERGTEPWQDETEAVALAGCWEDDFVALAAEPRHSHLHYHTGSSTPHKHAHSHGDGTHDGHGRNYQDLRDANRLVRGQPGSIHEAEAQRYADLAHEMGLHGPGRVRNMGPRPGPGRSVTTGSRAHAPDNASDRRPPVPGRSRLAQVQVGTRTGTEPGLVVQPQTTGPWPSRTHKIPAMTRPTSRPRCAVTCRPCGPRSRRRSSGSAPR
jgi:hypothetical protein